MSGKPIVAFDVLGTCFGIEALAEALERELSAVIPGHDWNELALLWYYQAMRDFSFLSQIGSYTVMSSVWKEIVPRLLATVLESHSPRPKLLDDSSVVDRIAGALGNLRARPGLVDGMRLLEANGFTVWGITNGGAESSKKLFSRAGYDIGDRVVSCDDIKKAKPDMRIYEHLLERARLDPAQRNYFVAAHAWDLAAARKHGFTTVFTTYEEHESVATLFGTPDIVADDLLAAAELIVAHAKDRSR